MTPEEQKAYMEHVDPLGVMLEEHAKLAQETPAERAKREAKEIRDLEDRAHARYKRPVFDFVHVRNLVSVEVKVPGKAAFKDAFSNMATLTEIRAKHPGATVHIGTQPVTTTIQEALDILHAPKKKASKNKKASPKDILLKRKNSVYKPIRNTPLASKHYSM